VLRSLAFKSIDWAVFEYPHYYEELKLSVRAFSLACDIIETADKIDKIGT